MSEMFVPSNIKYGDTHSMSIHAASNPHAITIGINISNPECMVEQIRALDPKMFDICAFSAKTRANKWHYSFLYGVGDKCYSKHDISFLYYPKDVKDVKRFTHYMIEYSRRWAMQLPISGPFVEVFEAFVDKLREVVVDIIGDANATGMPKENGSRIFRRVDVDNRKEKKAVPEDAVAELRKVFYKFKARIVTKKDDYDPCIWLNNINEPKGLYKPTICVPQKNGNGNYFWLPPMPMNDFLNIEKVPRHDGKPGDEHTSRFYSGRIVLVFNKLYGFEDEMLFSFAMYNYSILRYSNYGVNVSLPNFNANSEISMPPMDEDEEREEMERERAALHHAQQLQQQPIAQQHESGEDVAGVEDDDDDDVMN